MDKQQINKQQLSTTGKKKMAPWKIALIVSTIVIGIIYLIYTMKEYIKYSIHLDDLNMANGVTNTCPYHHPYNIQHNLCGKKCPDGMTEKENKYCKCINDGYFDKNTKTCIACTGTSHYDPNVGVCSNFCIPPYKLDPATNKCTW